MSAKKNLLHKLSIGLVVLGLMVISAVWVSGQTSSEIKVGRAPAQAPTAYVDDWSHHHLVFSNPGTEADALAKNRYEEWLKITSDPRYQLQQLKRGAPTRPLAPAVTSAPQDFASRIAAATVPGDFASRIGVALARTAPSPGPVGSPARRPASLGQPIKKDWSVDLNGAGAVGTISGNNATSSSYVSINGDEVTASAPTAQAGEFVEGAYPASGSTLIIGGVSYNFSNTPLGTSPTSGTCNVATSTFSHSTVIDNLYYAMSKGTGTHAASNTTWECNSNATPNPGVTGLSVTASGGNYYVSATASLTYVPQSESISYTLSANSNATNFTFTQTTAPSDGTTGNSTWAYWASGVPATASQLATNIASAINQSTAGTPDLDTEVTALANGDEVIVTALTEGTGGHYALTVNAFSDFTWSPTTLGGGNTATVEPNALPAVFGASLTSASCSNDWVAYPTGMSGSTTAASIVAYSNIYSSCAGDVPTESWAVNSGGAVTTSPVLSLDGTQMAYVQSSGTAATLVLLGWATGGTLASPVTPTNQTSGANYNSCTPAANAPCMYKLTFANGKNDTFSAPFYDNVDDAIYVGDDSGNLHKFTNVFNGSPAEAGSPWPVALGTAKLDCPVYDLNSGYVFVGDYGGTLYSVSGSAGTLHGNTGSLGDVIADGPLVDSTVEEVTVFVTSSGTGKPYPGDNVAVDFTAGFTAYGSPGTVYLGAGGTGYYLYDGAFDNLYFTTGGTGYLYTVADTGGTTTDGATLYQVGLSAGFFTGADNATVTGLSFTGSGATHGWPSPVSEFCNNGASACGLNPQASFTGGVSSGSKTVTGPTGTFSNADVGSGITGTAIPNGDTIASVASSTSATMATAATATHSSETITITGGNSTNPGSDYVFFSVNRGAVGGCSTTAGDGCVLSYNVSNPSAVAISGTGYETVTSGTNGCWATGGIVIDNSDTTTGGASQMYFLNFNGIAAGGPTAGTATSTGCTAGAATAIIDGVQTSQSNP